MHLFLDAVLAGVGRGVSGPLYQKALVAACVAAVVAYTAFRKVALRKGLDHLQMPPVKTKGLAGLLFGHIMDHINESYGDSVGYFENVHGMDLKRPRRHHIFRQTWLACCHPADIRHILVSNAGNYKKPGVYKQMFGRLLGEGILTQSDSKVHAEHRRILAPAFSPAALKHIADAVVPKHASILIDGLRQRAADGKPFVVQECISEATVQIMAEAVFKTKTLQDTKNIVSLGKRATQNMGNEMRMLPFVDMLLFSANRTIAYVRGELSKRVDAIAEELKQSGEVPSAQYTTALIDYLIYSNKFSPSILLDQSITFMFAGHETTNNSLNWMCYIMAKNPHAQEKLYEELCDSIGKNKQCKIDDLKGCAYLMNCVKEVLRYRGVAPFSARVALEDDVLPGTKTFVPRGTCLQTEFYCAMHNPEIWGSDAEEYRPERWDEFTDENRDLRELAFTPFSSGSRGCIGKDFAMNEMLLLGAAMFRNFQFVWPKNEPEPNCLFQLTLAPKDPLHLIVHDR